MSGRGDAGRRTDLFPLYCRAVYLLFLRGHWSLLEGADRADLEPRLLTFVELLGGGELTEDIQIVPLLACAPEVAELAMNLMAKSVEAGSGSR